MYRVLEGVVSGTSPQEFPPTHSLTNHHLHAQFAYSDNRPCPKKKISRNFLQKGLEFLFEMCYNTRGVTSTAIEQAWRSTQEVEEA